MTIRYKKILGYAMFILFSIMLSATEINAQSIWDQCTDGSAIERCETYDCPLGDTNNDGSCTLDDNSSRLTDVRNDSFCANPISGCGEVRYYPSNNSSACSVRVEENNNNCNLYTVGSPGTIPTPTPTVTATPRPVASPVVVIKPVCSTLVVSKSEGVAPLVSNLEIKPTGSFSQIKEYEFAITNPINGKTGTIVQSSPKLKQTFTSLGKHNIKAYIVTTTGEKITSASCNKTVEVSKLAIGGAGAGGDSLPETGSPLFAGVFIVFIGATGVYLYEKFRFI